MADFPSCSSFILCPLTHGFGRTRGGGCHFWGCSRRRNRLKLACKLWLLHLKAHWEPSLDPIAEFWPSCRLVLNLLFLSASVGKGSGMLGQGWPLPAHPPPLPQSEALGWSRPLVRQQSQNVILAVPSRFCSALTLACPLHAASSAVDFFQYKVVVVIILGVVCTCSSWSEAFLSQVGSLNTVTLTVCGMPRPGSCR